MTEKEKSNQLGKKIQLLGFDRLDDSEITIVKDLMLHYIKKLEKKTNYDFLKLTLKMHQRHKTFIHELRAELAIHPGMFLNSTASDKNLYKALGMVMEKILSELDHLKKKSPRNRPIKKFSRKLI